MAAHDPVTPKQKRELARLADLTGTTHAHVRTRGEASQEIRRMRRLPGSRRYERHQDRQAVRRGLAERQSASSVRDDEIEGYGSSARWA